ncbi:hypothetical protein AAGS40_29625 (plasmid) [Paraburkholderia sp. PREW-6R]|uniref:hypothetical protein n=1 Tax=Paraburkholderia sp. PREW-6R TaxID=3141544 RepID=UPI0031F4F654
MSTLIAFAFLIGTTCTCFSILGYLSAWIVEFSYLAGLYLFLHVVHLKHKPDTFSLPEEAGVELMVAAAWPLIVPVMLTCRIARAITTGTGRAH